MAATMAMTARTATTWCSLFGPGNCSWVQAWPMGIRRPPSQRVRGSLRLCLFPRYCHVLDQDRAAGAAAAHDHVAADGRDLLEHVAQVAGDGDFLHRIGDLAVFHPVAGGAARIVAG